MSIIIKMKILGIRSFSPETFQSIEFHTPLTLIVGQNGSGKTTIIECLRYMFTGDMPPGNKGGAFVHEPSLCHEKELKAQIGLSLTSVSGTSCIVQRSLQSTGKSCKTLDGVITRIAEDGSKMSVTRRCVDLNYEIVELVGVSKAILENVVFCHQEDITWPLSEGKVLKERFDGIFASAKYSKALDSINKIRKDKLTEAKSQRELMTYLRNNRHQAQRLRMDLEEREESIRTHTAQLNEAKLRMCDLKEQFEGLMRRSDQLRAISVENERCCSTVERLEENCAFIKKSLKDVMEEQLGVLKDRLGGHNRDADRRKDRIIEVRGQKERVEREAEAANRELSALMVEKGGLTQEAKSVEAAMERRRQLTEGGGTNLVDMRERISALRRARDGYDGESARKVDAERTRISACSNKIEFSRQQLTLNEEKLRKIDREMARFGDLSGKLGSIDRDISSAREELDSVRVERLQESLSCTIKERDAAQEELNSIPLGGADGRAELTLLAKHYERNCATVREIIDKHGSLYHRITGRGLDAASSAGEFRREVEDLAATVRRHEEERGNITQRISSLEVTKEFVLTQIRAKREEVTRIKGELFDVCGSTDIEEHEGVLSQSMRKLEKDLGFITGSQAHFERYVAQLRSGDGACPLCRRAFPSEEECADLAEELESQINLIPRQINTKSEQLNSLRLQHNRVQQLIPSGETLRKDSGELTKLHAQLASVQEEVAQLTFSLKEMARREDMEGAKLILPDLSLLGQINEENKSLSADMEMIKSKHCSTDDGRRSSLEAKLAGLRGEVERGRIAVESAQSRVSELRLRVAHLENERLRVTDGGALLERLVSERGEVTRESNALAADIDALGGDWARAEENAERLAAERAVRLREDDSRIGALEGRVVEEEGRLRSIDELTRQIERFGGGLRLVEVKRLIREAGREVESLGERRASLGVLLEELNYEVSHHDTICHSLLENIRLKETEEELGVWQEKAQGLKSTVEEGRRVEEQMERLRGEMEEVGNETIKLETRAESLKTESAGMKRRLERDYKDSECQFRVALGSLRVCESVCGDLDVFYRELDQCVGIFHREKMEELNKIIRDLWRCIYRGSDIDGIELRYEVEGRDGLKRRNFNYRVVMLKGEMVMDMRGRCSAGQKMLASLIIRLALAEAFCVNCGILALDEPTSNLDSANIEGLACALNDILSTRHGQRNFQLVVITHDEEFVELLSRTGHCDSFYRVSKDLSGYSLIESCNIGDLRKL